MRVMTIAAACLLALGLAAPEHLYAQKGRPLAATGSFRCTAGDAPDNPCPAAQDGVRDDGAVYNFLLSSGEGSQLNTNGEYYLWLQSGGEDRRLRVDLSNPQPGQYCETTTCYYQQEWGTFPVIDIYDGWLRTNVVDTAGNELKGGLTALPCGAEHDSRMLITFTNATQTDATKTVSMSLRWYSDAFPDSDMVKVTRHSRTAFTIEALEQSAKAVLMGSTLVRGKLQNTRQEGVFDLPFKLQVTVPGAPAKTGCGES